MNNSSTNRMRRVAQISSAIVLAWAAVAGVDATTPTPRICEQGERGRLIGYQKMRSYPTPDDARAHFEEFDHVNSWIQALPRAVEWFRGIDRP